MLKQLANIKTWVKKQIWHSFTFTFKCKPVWSCPGVCWRGWRFAASDCWTETQWNWGRFVRKVYYVMPPCFVNFLRTIRTNYGPNILFLKCSSSEIYFVKKDSHFSQNALSQISWGIFFVKKKRYSHLVSTRRPPCPAILSIWGNQNKNRSEI